jgi:hypothetical protein
MHQKRDVWKKINLVYNFAWTHILGLHMEREDGFEMNSRKH